MPGAAVNTEALAAAVRLCFEKARNNVTFSEEQCARFLQDGERLRCLFVRLISASFTTAVPGVDAANERLDSLVARLADTEETLRHYADTVQRIADAVGLLDRILKLAAPV